MRFSHKNHLKIAIFVAKKPQFCLKIAKKLIFVKFCIKKYLFHFLAHRNRRSPLLFAMGSRFSAGLSIFEHFKASIQRRLYIGLNGNRNNACIGGREIDIGNAKFVWIFGLDFFYKIWNFYMKKWGKPFQILSKNDNF